MLLRTILVPAKQKGSTQLQLITLQPLKNTAVAKFVIAVNSTNQTKVSWEFRGATKFPMSLFKGIFEKMLGKDMEKSLNNLKQVLEK